MRFLAQYMSPFLLAWLATYSLASLFHSQFIANELIAVGVKVTFWDRVSLSLDDWLGLLPKYGTSIAGTLLIAYSIAALVVKRVPNWRFGLFLIAGASSIGFMLLAMHPLLNVTLIAGARDAGFFAQVLAGAVGGAVFAKAA